MAVQAVREEFVLGSPAGPCCRNRVVRSDDFPPWLEIRRSVHCSASLRSLCHQQVPPPGANLFLHSRAGSPVSTVDDILSRGISGLASLALARRLASGP